MATSIALVRVTPVEATGGHLITCNRCALRLIRPYRDEADTIAAHHQRSHVAGTPTTQHDGLADR